MAHTKAVRFIGRNDYAAVVDGQEVGFSSTVLGAENICNDYVAGLVELEARAVAADVAPIVAADVASAAPVVAPTRAAVAAVLVEARAACADNARWLRAANKAAVELETGAWAFNGRVLVVRSRTTNRQYHATASTCECSAFAKNAPCWHRAAARLVAKAARAAA